MKKIDEYFMSLVECIAYFRTIKSYLIRMKLPGQYQLEFSLTYDNNCVSSAVRSYLPVSMGN